LLTGFFIKECEEKVMSDLNLTDIQIKPINPQNGLVAFASAVFNNQFRVGNIAIYTSPNSKQGYRLVYPNKKLPSGKVVDCFYPITQEAGQTVSQVIIKKYIELMDNFNHLDAV
jgi:DNA-binding cell septation regulator SpoVG